jgi:hypothetical protein
MRKIYKVVVDYCMYLGNMIDVGNYDWVEDNIDDNYQHFPIKGAGSGVKKEVELVLVTVKEVLKYLLDKGQAVKAQNWVTTRQVVEYMVSQGLSPALLEFLLALGASFPNIQRKFPVFALGSFFISDHGGREYPFLDYDDEGRGINHTWADDSYKWYDKSRFLAVHETT